MPYDHLLSVGFVNERPDPTRHHETFDAVVHGNAGSLLPVEELMEEIAPMPTIIRTLSSLKLGSLTDMMSLSMQNGPASPTAPAA